MLKQGLTILDNGKKLYKTKSGTVYTIDENGAQVLGKNWLYPSITVENAHLLETLYVKRLKNYSY